MPVKALPEAVVEEEKLYDVGPERLPADEISWRSAKYFFLG